MSLTQTINKNRKSMNKEYFVLEIEDTSSAEYRKNYWKKAAENDILGMIDYLKMIEQ